MQNIYTNQSILSSKSTDSQSKYCEYPENQIQRSKETIKLPSFHHYICIFNPSIGEEDIRSIQDLQDKIRQRFHGLLRNKLYKRHIKQAELHIAIHMEFSKRQIINAQELKILSGKMRIPLNTLRKWVLKGTIPVIYRWISESIKNQKIAAEIRGKLNGYDNPKLVLSKLGSTQLDETIDAWSTAKREWFHLQKYYDVLVLLEAGTLHKDIVRETHVQKTTLDSWLIGHLPWALRFLIDNNSPRSLILAKSYHINIFDPQFGKYHPRNFKEIISIIDSQYPGIKESNDFPFFIDQAQKHFELLVHLEGHKIFSIYQLRQIAEKLDIEYTTARNWTIEGVKPQIYHVLDLLVQRESILKALRSNLPIHSYSEFQKREETLYLLPHLRRWNNYSALEYMVEKYFKFLDMFEIGYLQNDIARILNIGERTVYDWLQWRFPLLLYMIQDVSDEPLESNISWLPIKLDGRRFIQIIRVPENITNYADVKSVINQFEHISEAEFIYILGFMVADGYIALRSKISYALKLVLGSVYEWSEDILRANGILLESLGISYYRYKANYNSKGRIELQSSSSPLFIWIREVLLGLDSCDVKTYTDLDLNWLSQAPRNVCIAFIQGLADGDGYASISGLQAGITGYSNRTLIHELLHQLGISTKIYNDRVLILRQQELQKAASLPLFKYAQNRSRNLFDIDQLVIAKQSVKQSHISNSEKSLITHLCRDGLSPGLIVAELWKSYGIVRSRTSIYRVLKSHTISNINQEQLCQIESTLKEEQSPISDRSCNCSIRETTGGDTQ